MILYTAGPYAPKNGRTTKQNIENARKVAIAVWHAGHFAMSPHMNTAGFENEELLKDIADEDYVLRDLEIIRRCDAILMMPHWEESTGSLQEKEYAESIGMPVYIYPEIPKLHPTEVGSPVQCQAFMETIMKMWRTHLDKNADYSPANIAGTGEIGLVTRLWDKMARLMSLTGFRMDIRDVEFKARPNGAINEPLEDTYIDLSVYGIIAKLYREGRWGH